ncbi:MAG: nitroreductase [Clostridiaceae bacterium]|nr:nitroreductase [Clostridiaceae bacterium]
MIQSNFYEVIFKRKSIRKYELKPLDIKVQHEIEEFAGAVKPLYEGIKTEIRIVSQGEASGLLSIKAPHYLIITSEKREGYLTNAGYMLQQIDLFLSSRGLGSCYLGLTRPIKVIKKELELEVVMVLAFGNPAEVLHRVHVSEFKRKSLQEITNITAYEQFLEPARLAPSATNSQPWYFTGDNEKIHVYCVKTNLLKALVYEKLNKFDIGIALYHLATAARNFHRGFEFVKEKSAESNPPKGYYYIGTVVIS